jgi:hypothetical protein
MVLIIVDGGLIRDVISEKDEKIIIADYDCLDEKNDLLYFAGTKILTKIEILAIINKLKMEEMKEISNG